MINDLLAEVIESPNLFSWLKYFSAITWNRIELLKNMKSRISETTITEILIMEFYPLRNALPIDIFISKNEKANGNDLEIYIETSAGFIFMPSQAKIIKDKYKYPSINHKVNGHDQIDLLLNYAEKKGGLAAYLFYNYSGHFFWNHELQEKIDFPFECYGCSLADATSIKHKYYNKTGKSNKTIWKIPSFYDLHPDLAMPLHFLAYLNKEKWFPFEQTLNGSSSLKLYSRAEIEKDKAWKEIIEPASIGRITSSNSTKGFESFLSSYNSAAFNPKFRIIFSSKIKESGLYRIS